MAVPEVKYESNCLTEIERIFGNGIRVQRNVTGSSITTFGVGGALDCIVQPTSLATLREVICYLNENNTLESKPAWRTLGAGSNLIIPDEGLKGVTLKLGKEFQAVIFLDECLDGSSNISSDELSRLQTRTVLPDEIRPKQKAGNKNYVLAFGGAPLIGLSRRFSQQGLSGFEFAAGIPGSVGGAIKMNAGAHGSQISDVVNSVFVYDSLGGFQCLNKEDLKFSYRHSSITHDRLVVAAVFCLEYGDADRISEKRSKCLEYRKRTQPLHLPSAGSVFRNPFVSELNRGADLFPEGQSAQCKNKESDDVNVPAARLLEVLGFKGLTLGGVRYSELHANWLVRVAESAKACDAISLMQSAEEKVFDKFGVRLKREIIYWY